MLEALSLVFCFSVHKQGLVATAEKNYLSEQAAVVYLNSENQAPRIENQWPNSMLGVFPSCQVE